MRSTSAWRRNRASALLLPYFHTWDYQELSWVFELILLILHLSFFFDNSFGLVNYASQFLHHLLINVLPQTPLMRF